MGEARRLMSSVGSQHGSGSGRGSKRGQRTTPNGGATVPGSGSGDPSSFRPDSQFAAVPQLPGEAAQTAGVSGDDDDGGSGDANASGSGQNGSGGGSTSPQQVGRGVPPPAPLPYMYLAHTAVATPSGASVAPNATWQWGVAAPPGPPAQQEQQQAAPPAARGLPPVPQGPPQMAPWVGQDAGLAAVGFAHHQPSHAAGADKAAAAPTAKPAVAAPPAGVPAPPPPADAQPVPPPPFGPGPPGAPPMMMMPPGMPAAASNDPMSWWYQNYYGAAQAAASFQHAQAAAHAQQVGRGGGQGMRTLAAEPRGGVLLAGLGGVLVCGCAWGAACFAPAGEAG